jgi:hypothetical protein
LQTGPYGGCIFHVEIVSADLGIDEEHDVEIDCDSLNVTILGTYSNGDHWTLFLSCAWCNECEAALVHCCGEARQMPRVLTATINGEGDCPQGTGTLTYNEDCAFWEGSAVLTNGEILAMLFRCNGDPAIGPVESNLAVNQCIAPPADPWSGNYPCACENQFGFCGLAATPPVEALCDPVYVRFNLGILLNASCCNTVDPGSGLFIEITE